MKYKLSKPVIALAAIATIGAGFGIAAFANADTTTAGTTTAATATGMQNHRGAPGVHGKVTGITGNMISVTTTNPKDSTSVIYTVDASNAKIMKMPAAPTTSDASTTPTTRPTPTTIAVSDIAVGDTVNVQGTISGTTVTATDIMDGEMGFGGMRGGPGGFGGGDHGASGKITAVNGSTVTITDKNGKTYTIDASSAKLEKVSTISVSDLAVGDTINAEGTVSGTTVTAQNIMDGMPQMGPRGPQNGGQNASSAASATTTATN